MPKYTNAVFYVGNFPGADDDGKIANCLKAIKDTVPAWLTATMVFDSGAWNLHNPILIDRSIFLTSSGRGAGSCLLGWSKAVEQQGGKCVHYKNANYAGISNLGLLFNAGEPINDCTMLHVEDCGRNRFTNLWIAPGRNSGINNIGIYHERGTGTAGRGESSWFSCMTITAPRPIVIHSGNSMTFTNADIGAYNSSSVPVSDQHVNAAFTFLNPAWQVKFRDMSVQKGKHLLYCKYQGPNCGNSLTLDDVRYEQQTDHKEPAIYYHATRANGLFGQEMLTWIIPRCSHLPTAEQVTDVQGVNKFSIVGGWWFGADTHIGQKPKTMWDRR